MSRVEKNGAGGGAVPPGAVAPPFPCASFMDAAPHLRRPFAANAIKWKIQTGNMVVPYVDARSVIERLNLVVPHLWSAEYRPWGERVDTNLLICDLTIDGLTRSDVGKGQGTEAQKAAHSDSLKRAAVHFGVGVSLYALSRVYLDGRDNRPSLTKRKRGNKEIVEIGAEAERWLREKYQAWLGTARGQHFGDALDHGDEPDAVGDPVDATSEPVQDDLELAAKRQEIEKSYAALDGTARRKLPKGRFTAHLEAADSAEKLGELAEKVEALA